MRINSTIIKQLRLVRLASPRPVEPAAPTALSTYKPAPMIGESPTRPGILKLNPLVVVTAARSPLASSAEQWMVP